MHEGAVLIDNCYVITGPPGSGKTLVLRELVELGYRCLPEAAREVIEEQRAVDEQAIYDRDPALFVELMLERCLGELEGAGSDQAPVFFDRGIPDVVGQCELFGLDARRAWTAAKRHRYNDMVFALPPWPEIYTTDADRRMSYEAAAAFGERVREIYEELGYVVVDVPRATAAERADLIRDRVLSS